MSTFILEIGTEEIPARFLAAEETELERRFASALDDAALAHGAIKVFVTARRAIILVEDLADRQTEREEIVTGPPSRTAYDSNGSPTRAMEGFARTHGVEVSALFRLETEKGEYIAVRKKAGGLGAMEIMAGICPSVLGALPFPKRMRWGSGPQAYARPMQWLLALLDSDIVEFEFAGLKSGRETRGHRIHGKGPFVVQHATDLLDILLTKGSVVYSAAERRKIIIAEGDRLADEIGGSVLWKDSLLTEVEGLCEYPVPILGGFAPDFLAIPPEVLLTSMESHQKSFGIKGTDGKLLPYFLTILNMSPPDLDLVRNGWERVLRARLEDARFFWRNDLSENFAEWLKRLDSVVFLGPLGSMGDKTRRLESLCSWLAENHGLGDRNKAARAGRLSKADLVTGMVGEFDTLQGHMGAIYALEKGEDTDVANALADQYLPAGPDSPLPSTMLGAILSMADKSDTLAGCFGLNMIPSGTADPNGLRRCALGIARIILEYGLRVNIWELLDKAQEAYGPLQWKLSHSEAMDKMMDFIEGRIKNLFIHQGYETLLVEAAAGAGFSDLVSLRQRLEALKKLTMREDFALTVQTCKRATNIIRKQGQEAEGELSGHWDESLLREQAEINLAEAYKRILPEFDSLLGKDAFDDLFPLILELRPTMDAFFEGVMVMCEEVPLRNNRLNMLKALVDRLDKLANFAALQV